MTVGSQQISISHHILCQRSGIAMGTMELFLHEGHIAYLQSHNESIYLHPFYNLSPAVVIRKFDEGMIALSKNGYVADLAAKHRMQLLFSAIAWSFECIKQDHPGLPSWQVTIGSGTRLLDLAKWYYYSTSNRLPLPELHLARHNENCGWENVRFWLNACYSVKEDWESKSRKVNMEALLNTKTAALKEIKSESYRRIDLNKVWSWVEVQLDGNTRRCAFWKKLFLEGDMAPEDYTEDDVDDLIESVVSNCDLGNEIMHFIQKRLAAIKMIIRDFYGSFTLVTRFDRNLLDDDGRPRKEATGETEVRTKQEIELLDMYNEKLDLLGALPPKPKRESFATLGSFMKSEAQWNIMARLWKSREERGPVAVAQPVVQPVVQMQQADNTNDGSAA